MHQEGYWVVRTYEAGPVGEKTKFFVPGTRPTGKTRRKERQEIKKQEQNEYAAVKAMARLLNANFTDGDYVFGLDYSEEGLNKILAWGEAKGLETGSSDETAAMDAVRVCAEHALDNAIRRVKYRLEKKGIALKAVYITSDMDGETGEAVRVHHHLVINREAREAFEDAWKDYGHCAWSTLWEYQLDRTQLAEYMIRQVRRVADAKKYRSTRNLIRPQPKDRVALGDSELRLPKGAALLFRQEFKPGRPQYIRYAIEGMAWKQKIDTDPRRGSVIPEEF